MTNIFGPRKHDRKRRLFQIGLGKFLQKQGIERHEGETGKVKRSAYYEERREQLVSIRTTQDQWLAFPPKPDRKG